MHAKLYFMKAYAVSRMGDIDEAIALYKISLEIDAQNSDSHFYLGVLLDKQQDTPLARYHLKRSIELDPWNAQAYNYLGYMDVEAGRNLEQAIALVQKALALDPDNAAYRDSLGWAYYKQGLYKKAAEELEKAVAIDDQDEIINQHLAEAYDRIGESQKSKELRKQK